MVKVLSRRGCRGYCISCDDKKGPFVDLYAGMSENHTISGKRTSGVTINLCAKCAIILGSKLAKWIQKIKLSS